MAVELRSNLLTFALASEKNSTDAGSVEERVTVLAHEAVVLCGGQFIR